MMVYVRSIYGHSWLYDAGRHFRGQISDRSLIVVILKHSRIGIEYAMSRSVIRRVLCCLAVHRHKINLLSVFFCIDLFGIRLKVLGEDVKFGSG